MAHIQNWMKVFQTGGNLCIFNRMPACISGCKIVKLNASMHGWRIRLWWRFRNWYIKLSYTRLRSLQFCMYKSCRLMRLLDWQSEKSFVWHCKICIVQIVECRRWCDNENMKHDLTTSSAIQSKWCKHFLGNSREIWLYRCFVIAKW